MRTGHTEVTPNILGNCASRARFLALTLVFCISVNNVYPRAIIELKNYDVVVLAMGSQSVFLHLFALPSNVSIQLANLLFGNKSQSIGDKAAKGHKPKTATNSSSDFSMRIFDKRQVLKSLQLSPTCFGIAGIRLAAKYLSECLINSALFRPQAMLYFVFLMLLFSRPRGDTANNLNNPILNNSKPGLFQKLGFSFAYCHREAVIAKAIWQTLRFINSVILNEVKDLFYLSGEILRLRLRTTLRVGLPRSFPASSADRQSFAKTVSLTRSVTISNIDFERCYHELAN